MGCGCNMRQKGDAKFVRQEQRNAVGSDENDEMRTLSTACLKIDLKNKFEINACCV